MLGIFFVVGGCFVGLREMNYLCPTHELCGV